MKEYWINVYWYTESDEYIYCEDRTSRGAAEIAAWRLPSIIKLIYRIHVRPKNRCNHDGINEEYFK